MIAQPLKIVVLEATGRTGLEFVRIALGDAMEVTSVVEGDVTPAGLERTTIVRSPRSVADLAAAFEGADVVVSLLTPSSRDPQMLERSTAALLAGMKKAGVPRLVVLSDSGPFTNGDDPLTKGIVKPVLQAVMAKPFGNIKAMEQLVRSSGTRWTIIRPPQVTDRRAKGKWESRRDGNVQWGFRITRGDLAKAVYDAVVDDTGMRKTISVANSQRANSWPARPR